MWRLYEYGCLHGYVCFDTDDWRVRCRVDWNVGCLPDLQHIAREAIETGAEMDVVLCAVSGWERPWRDALRVCVTEMDDELLTVVPVDDGPAAAFSLDEIQAIRAVPADEQKAVQWPCDYHNVC